jgi:hypothetical protein
MRRTSRPVELAICLLAALALATFALAQSSPQADHKSTEGKTVPVIDGGVGLCSADLTITDNAGAPVYAATIQVHVAYGFMYLRKLDLQVGTNTDGKARFTGLPQRTKSGLFFRASEGNREGSAFDDPANTCKGDFTIALQEKSH